MMPGVNLLAGQKLRGEEPATGPWRVRVAIVELPLSDSLARVEMLRLGTRKLVVRDAVSL